MGKQSRCIIGVSKISKGYNSRAVIKDISLYLNKGEIVCLLGPSGCGKTTLFRLIAGLEKPERGEISIAPASRVAYVFQEPRLLPWRKVENNLELVQQNYLDREEAEKMRKELLTLSGLSDFKDNYPSQLSGGMKQRLELIRALAIKPELILMDEPFKSVDTLLKINLRKMILQFWRREKESILLITHDPEEAVLLADRIYLLSEKPTTILREIKISKPQFNRTIKDEEIYQHHIDIIDILSKKT